MRTRWLPCLALSFLAALAAQDLAARQNSQNSPALFLRFRSLDALFDAARQAAALFGQEQALQQIEDLLKSKAGPKGLEAIDAQRPLGLYAHLGGDPGDLKVVVLLPVASEKGFLDLLDALEYKAVKDKDGLYVVKQNIFADDVHLRFANGYAYLTPHGAAALAAPVEPGKVFLAKQTAAVSLTAHIDRIPEKARQSLAEQFKGGLGKALDDKLPGESDAQQAFRTELVKELQRQVESALRDGDELNAEVDLDAKGQQLSADVRLTARSGTELSAAIEKLGQGNSLFGALAREGAAMNLLVRYSLPERLRDALAAVVAETAAKALAQTNDPDTKKKSQKLFDALAPTFKGGDLDAAVSLRGPDAGKRFTLVAGLKLLDAEKVAAVLRELVEDLPQSERERIKLDFEKAGQATIHRLDVANAFNAQVKATFGEGPVYVAVRPDALLVAAGEEALKAIREAATAEPAAGAPLRFELTLARLAVLTAKTDADRQFAEKLLASGEDSRVRITVEGGRELRLRLQIGLAAVRLLSGRGAEDKK